MRRIVGLVLAGLGTCLIVFAVLMPTYVSSRVLKFPLNQYATATLVDPNASYFSPTKLTEMTGVTMEATYTLKGNQAAGSSSTAVWNQFVYVYDQTNKVPFQTMARTMAFDRRSAELVNCCGSNVSGDSSVQQRGIVGYVFPIGTQKQTYQVFDANLLKPVPFTFAGTDTVNGIGAYRFVENVAPTQNGSQTLPGSLVGQSESSVTLPQFYQTNETYWIDPDTGALLRANQDEKVFLENSAGAQALLLFNGNLAMTPSSVKGLVAIDNDQRSKKFMVETVLPLVTGIAGAVLLIVGILLGRKPREEVAAPLTTPAPESAAPAQTTQAPAAPAPSSESSLVPGLDDGAHEATVESAVQTQAAAEAPAAAETAAETAAEPASETAAEPASETAQAPAATDAESPDDASVEPGIPEAGKSETETPQAATPAAEPAEPSEAEAPAAPAAPAAPEANGTPTAELPATASETTAANPQPSATAPQPAAAAAQRNRRGARHRR